MISSVTCGVLIDSNVQMGGIADPVRLIAETVIGTVDQAQSQSTSRSRISDYVLGVFDDTGESLLAALTLWAI